MQPQKPQRYGQTIRLKPGAYEKYVEYHAQVWPGVLKTIHDCNIRNYSVFFKDDVLFAYFEYVGSNFDKDMAKMAVDPITQEWWAVVKPLQQPIPSRAEGEWWATMKEVFHTE
jgi:L-rhamnose mutarotase